MKNPLNMNLEKLIKNPLTIFNKGESKGESNSMEKEAYPRGVSLQKYVNMLEISASQLTTLDEINTAADSLKSIAEKETGQNHPVHFYAEFLIANFNIQLEKIKREDVSAQKENTSTQADDELEVKYADETEDNDESTESSESSTDSDNQTTDGGDDASAKKSENLQELKNIADQGAFSSQDEEYPSPHIENEKATPDNRELSEKEKLLERIKQIEIEEERRRFEEKEKKHLIKLANKLELPLIAAQIIENYELIQEIAKWRNEHEAGLEEIFKTLTDKISVALSTLEEIKKSESEPKQTESIKSENLSIKTNEIKEKIKHAQILVGNILDEVESGNTMQAIVNIKNHASELNDLLSILLKMTKDER